MNVGRVGTDRDVEVRRPGRSVRRRSATVIPVVSSPRGLDVDEQGLGRDEGPVQGRRERQRIVDERAVEPVVAARGTPCRTAARRRRSGRSGSLATDRVASIGSSPRASAIESSGRAAGPTGEPDDMLGQDPGALGDIEAEAERPRDGRVAARASAQARKTIFAASGSQWMFHSVVGVVLPGTPNAPPISM